MREHYINHIASSNVMNNVLANRCKKNEQYIATFIVFGAHIELDRVRDPHHIIFNGSIPRQFNVSFITMLKALTNISLAETRESSVCFRIGTCS